MRAQEEMFGFSIGTKTLDYDIGIISFLVSLVVNLAIYIILSFEIVSSYLL